MTDAVLGFKVESRGLKEGIDQLKALPPAAQKAEAAVENMNSGASRALNRMAQEFVRANARIKGTLGQISSDLNASTSGFVSGFATTLAAGFSANAVKQLLDSATRIKNALKVVGLSGDDLTKVYDRLYASAQKNGAPLETLAVLYGRAAQQQKELGVSSEQLLKFTDNIALALRVAGTDAQTASGALLQLGQALGSGTVHAEEFNSVLEGVPTIAQTAARGIKEANGSVAALKQLVNDGKISSKAFFDGFAAGAETLAARAAGSETTISAGFVRLQNVLVDVASRFDDSTHASRILANMIDHTLIPAITELGAIFSGVTNGPIGTFYDWLGKTIDRVVQLSADLGSLTGADQLGGHPYIGQGRIQDRIDSAFAGASYTTPKGGRKPLELTVDKPGAVVKPISLADYPVTGGKTKGSKGGHWKSADDEFDFSIQDVKDRTAALAEEQAALGLSFEAQQKRKVSLDLEQEALKQVREEARRKGDADWQNAQLSPDQVKAIDDVSTAYARQAEQLRKATEAQEFQRDVLQGAFDDLRSAIEDGKLSWQDLGNVGMGVLDKLVDKIENDLINAIMDANNAASGGGSIFGSIASFLFGGSGGGGGSQPPIVGGDPWLGMRANGGPVTAGKPYIVGERRPELFVPSQSGTILPRVPSMSSTAPGATNGNAPVVNLTLSPIINVSHDGQGNAGDQVTAALKKFKKEMTPMVVSALREAKTLGYTR